MKRLLILVLLLGAAAAPAHARLGETVSQLKDRFKMPGQQTRKDAWVWLFEDEDEGQLMFTATFDAEGVSIAEGLKPVRRAKLSQENAETFVKTQLEPYQNSKTIRTYKTGQKYRFAGHDFTCGQDEVAIVDEPNGLMIIWNKSATPAILAVRPVMLQ